MSHPKITSQISNDNRNETKQPMAFNILFLPTLAPEVKSLQMFQMNSFIFLFIINRMGAYPVLTHKKLLLKVTLFEMERTPGMA